MDDRSIRKLFAPYGEITMVEVDINPTTGLNPGYAVVKFTTPQSAIEAIKGMNGYLVGQTPLIVTQLTPYMTMGTRPSQLQDKEDFVRKYTEAVKPIEAPELPASKYSLPPLDKNAPKVVQTIVEKVSSDKYYVKEPTRALGLFNLFDIEDRRLTEDRRFLNQLIDDVEDELKSIGRIENLRLEKGNCYGLFALFEDRHDAKKAFKKLSEKIFDGRKIICAFFEKEIFNVI